MKDETRRLLSDPVTQYADKIISELIAEREALRAERDAATARAEAAEAKWHEWARASERFICERQDALDRAEKAEAAIRAYVKAHEELCEAQTQDEDEAYRSALLEYDARRDDLAALAPVENKGGDDGR